jgi:hypothetical protein
LTKVNPLLLVDIARLVSRYSAEEWEDLLELLQSPRFREQMISFVAQIRKISQESQRPSRRWVRSDDVEFRRAMLLDEIRSDLRTRRLNELRELAQFLDVRFDNKTKRAALVNTVMKTLSHRTLSEIRKAAPPKLFERSPGEDYDRWERLIMGPHSKGTPR